MNETLRLGFIPLIDCAVLAVAQEEGFFAAEGLNVHLSQEPSWANIRDKLSARLLHGAHALAPLVLASRMGLGATEMDLIVPLALNRGGAAITISHHLAAVISAAPDGLKGAVAARAASGAPPFTFGVVFPFSIHNYLLRDWLGRQGVRAGEDVRLIVAPPPQMAARLGSGELDGISVGAPWNLSAIESGAGVCAVRATEIWPDALDKVFCVKEDWAEANAGSLQAVLRALIRAAAWADNPANRTALASILALERYVGEPQDLILRSLQQDGVVFGPSALAVSPEATDLIYDQMVRWGQITLAPSSRLIAQSILRPAFFSPPPTAIGKD
jgi:NitT/TauT family transport system ATP-binding protein/nitrate/nitrite transport system substrate-binding protein